MIDAVKTTAKTPHDDLKLPGGKRLGDERRLASVLVDLGVPGASHSAGRLTNAVAYAAHLDSIGGAGARKAIAAWLDSKASK